MIGMMKMGIHLLVENFRENGLTEMTINCSKYYTRAYNDYNVHMFIWRCIEQYSKYYESIEFTGTKAKLDVSSQLLWEDGKNLSYEIYKRVGPIQGIRFIGVVDYSDFQETLDQHYTMFMMKQIPAVDPGWTVNETTKTIIHNGGFGTVQDLYKYMKTIV